MDKSTQVILALEKIADPKIAEHSARFFKQPLQKYAANHAEICHREISEKGANDVFEGESVNHWLISTNFCKNS